MSLIISFGQTIIKIVAVFSYYMIIGWVWLKVANILGTILGINRFLSRLFQTKGAKI